MESKEFLAILDCGGQYTKVIDRKIRELGVKTEIFPINVEPKQLDGCGGVILSGGPESIWHENALKPNKNLFELQIPFLGICYGMHVINMTFGGIVSPSVKKEFGDWSIDIDNSCPLFNGLSNKEHVLMSHGDSIMKVAEGFEVCGTSEGVVAAMYNKNRNIYGVQFHPEVDLTVNGVAMFENFLRKICKFKEVYSLEDRIEASINEIKEKVGDNDVMVLVSGGVDSAVTAALLLKALDNDKIFAIHIDHGFMRKNESDLICENLKKLGLKNLKRINAKEHFFNATATIDGKQTDKLTTLTDPEEKRNAIGTAFISVLQNNVLLDLDKTFLAQGTLRPDLIESGNPIVSVYAHKIKTHHNDVDIIRRAREKGLIIETNKDWHKDEVRQVGRLLGLDEEVTKRQPFPGPGLAVRLLCSDASETVCDEEVSAFSEIMLKNQQLSGTVLPIRSVGVKGDYRSFGHLALLHCEREAFDWDKTYSLSKTITNNIQTINRIAFVLNDIKEDTFKNLKCGSMYIDDENVSLLREVDYVVTEALKDYKISQTFCVLFPLGVSKKYSVAIRTFVTNDFMTGRPAFIGKEVEKEVIFKLANDIVKKFDEIEFVVYDVTGKPPATCEWE